MASSLALVDAELAAGHNEDGELREVMYCDLQVILLHLAWVTLAI